MNWQRGVCALELGPWPHTDQKRPPRWSIASVVKNKGVGGWAPRFPNAFLFPRRARGGGQGGHQKQSFHAVPRPLFQTKMENSLQSTLWPPRWASCGRQST